MKNIFFIALIFFLALPTANAQFLTQSADGKGTIPLPLSGLGLGVDIGKTEIAVGLNNYGKVLRNENNRKNLFLGLNLSVKNSSGLGNLFSSGDIVPSGDFLGFLGYTFSNNGKMLAKWKSSGFTGDDYYDKLITKQIFEDYRSQLKEDLIIALPKITDAHLADAVAPTINNALNAAGDYIGVTAKLLEAKAVLGRDSDLKDFWAKFTELEAEERKAARARYNQIFTAEKKKEKEKKFNEAIKEIIPLRITPFLFGGISARNFSIFTKAHAENFANSFIDTLYRGGVFGLGINAQYGNVWLGITYSYLDGDNFNSLSGREYTIKTTDTAGNQSLSREKKLTAYSGKYSKVETNQLNADLVWDIKINDSSRVLVNPYMRSSLFSRDTSYLKNYADVGLGLYFHGKKNTFIGGLYIELPDINNNIEKAKAQEDRNIRSPFKKLTFGVVTKFSLSSILTFQNRPMMTD